MQPKRIVNRIEFSRLDWVQVATLILSSKQPSKAEEPVVWSKMAIKTSTEKLSWLCSNQWSKVSNNAPCSGAVKQESSYMKSSDTNQSSQQQSFRRPTLLAFNSASSVSRILSPMRAYPWISGRKISLKWPLKRPSKASSSKLQWTVSRVCLKEIKRYLWVCSIRYFAMRQLSWAY